MQVMQKTKKQMQQLPFDLDVLVQTYPGDRETQQTTDLETDMSPRA